MKKIANTKQKMHGRFKISVIDSKSKRVIEERPWQNNLILDNGLDMYATIGFSDCWRYCSVGTDNTPVVVDSDTTTATQSGTTVTASASIFTANDVGRLFKFDSGEESYITAYTSGTVVTVADSRTIAAPTEFAIWRVNQTNLGAFSKRSSSYFTQDSGCGQSTTGSDGKVTMWRTWEFSSESGSVTYREIGVHYNDANDDELFARLLINGGAVSLNAGQQIRVRYEVNMYFALDEAIVPQSGTLSVTGWPAGGASTTDGDGQIVNILYNGVRSTGNSDVYINETSGPSGSGESEPNGSTPTYFWYSTSATALPTFGVSNTSGMTNIFQTLKFSASKSSYVSGTFTRSATFNFEPSAMATSSLRRIGYGSGSYVLWIFLFDENQEKLNTHRLYFTFTWTWGRVISANP